MKSDGGTLALGFFYLFLIAVAYLTPLIVALARHCRVGPVAVVNIFLGWSVIGWIVALAMACSRTQKTRPAGYY